MISETKIDDSFPVRQFEIDGFNTPFHTDRNHKGGGIHCVKSVQMLSFFQSVFSCIQFEYMKIRTRENSVFGHFPRSDNVLCWGRFTSKASIDWKNEQALLCWVKPETHKVINSPKRQPHKMIKHTWIS